MSLISRYFFHFARDYSTSGQIVDEAFPGMALVRHDDFTTEDRSPGKSMVLIPFADMVTKADEGGTYDHNWHFFETREELDLFYADMDADECDACKAQAASASVN